MKCINCDDLEEDLEALGVRIQELERKIETLTEWLSIVSAWAAVRDDTGRVFSLIRELHADSPQAVGEAESEAPEPL